MGKPLKIQDKTTVASF